MAALRSNQVRDKKTGRVRTKDAAKSRTAKRAAASRKGKPLKAATKAKIAKAVAKTLRTGKTKAGRKSLLKKEKTGSTAAKAPRSAKATAAAAPKTTGRTNRRSGKASRGTSKAASWWDRLSLAAQKEYIKEHPRSKFAKKIGGRSADIKRGKLAKLREQQLAGKAALAGKTAQAPAKRGRKPKATTPATAAPAVAPKKRGRPPKAAATAAPAVAPKKRGRAKKKDSSSDKARS